MYGRDGAVRAAPLRPHRHRPAFPAAHRFDPHDAAPYAPKQADARSACATTGYATATAACEEILIHPPYHHYQFVIDRNSTRAILPLISCVTRWLEITLLRLTQINLKSVESDTFADMLDRTIQR